MDSPHKGSVMQSLVFLDLGKLLNEKKTSWLISNAIMFMWLVM